MPRSINGRWLSLSGTLGNQITIFHATSARLAVRKRTSAVTLIELICVMAILGILMALYLPSLSHAFLRVKKFLFSL